MKNINKQKGSEYNHLVIEPKWQAYWNKKKLFKTGEKGDKPKSYVLDMFPYPSGDGLHVGHPRGYIATDVYSRFKRMNGFNVLHPMGWDAFGLPAENYAIANKISPDVAMKKNVKRFKKQLSIIGLSYDWDREIDTTDPKYYKWTQWIFLQLLKKGLAYESFAPINWCPSCKTGLANEDVEGGKCERCGTVVEKKPMRQWVLKIREYADRLLYDLDALKWPEHIKELQKNWIGRSEGAELWFNISHSDEKIYVFTTRPDTLYGVTYVVLAPESAERLMIQDSGIKNQIKNIEEVNKYIKEAKNKSEIERASDTKEKTGVELKGVIVKHPITKEIIPVFISDYVLGHYGTGAVMAVPAHDDRDYAFAQKYGLPIKEVVLPIRIDKRNPPREGKESKERKNVQVVVRNPKNGKILYLRSDKYNWNTFPMGGIEDGEDILEAAKREVLEETGYKNLTNGKILGGEVKAEYFANHKDENRISYTSLVSFDLVNEEKIEVSEEEKNNHVPKWADLKDLTTTFMVHAEMDIWLERISGSIAYCESGEMINSGQFDGMDSEEAKKKITEHAGGKMVTTYKLQDWVFSRQRYWGEPIPVVHCEDCAVEEYRREARVSLNFYYGDVWSALLNGTKTLETRALNPEEKNRYFGDVKVGDIINFSYRDKKSKKLKEEKLFRVKARKIYKSLNELFEDKVALSKLNKKNYKSITELEKAYSVYGEENFVKIKKNGLITWDVEPVTVVVPVPEKDLPVKLPKVKFYEPTGTGESPLADIEKWVNTKCPKCRGKAKRETNTMPQWAGSSWYYLRFIDPKNSKALVDKNKEKYWLGSPKLGEGGGVDMYVGGAEHATRHLVYARFWHKFLFDIGVVNYSEPFRQLKNQGMILGADNRKMSKRWGNVVNPDEVVKNVGADTLRVYESFMGPFEQEIAWSTDSMVGSRRFLEKVWKLQNKVAKNFSDSDEIVSVLHKTIKKVGEDIESFNNNTAISSMMILTNLLEPQEKISTETYLNFVKILSPFAPHMCEEIWSIFGNKKSLVFEVWPKYDENKLKSSKVKIAIQINGKLRATVDVPFDSLQDTVEKEIKENPEVVKWISGQKIIKIIFVKNKILNFVL
jgi:leucyl-tRNA synthetase